MACVGTSVGPVAAAGEALGVGPGAALSEALSDPQRCVPTRRRRRFGHDDDRATSAAAASRSTPGRAGRCGTTPPRRRRGRPRRAPRRAAGPPRRRPRGRRRARRARPGIGLGVTIGLAVTAESAGSLSAPGGIATALGRLAGLLAAYAMVVVVLLVARVPPLERAIGQDRLVRLAPHARPVAAVPAARARGADHRRLRAAAHDGVLHQFGQLLLDLLRASSPRPPARSSCSPPASRSYRLARRRMAYETWWSVHLYTYLALFLSFSHQIDTGASFVGHPVARFWWTVLWLGTLARRRRRAGRAAGVALAAPPGPGRRRRAEGPGVVSILLRGRRLDRLPGRRRAVLPVALPAPRAVVAGAPVLALGGAGGRPAAHHGQGPRRPQRRPGAAARPGTRVAIEGPYGTFTADTRRARPAAAGRRRRRHRADPRAAAGASRTEPT